MKTTANVLFLVGFLMILMNIIVHYESCTADEKDINDLYVSKDDRLVYNIASNGLFIIGGALILIGYPFYRIGNKNKPTKRKRPHLPGDPKPPES